MEAPVAVEGNERLAVAVEVEGLGVERGHAGKNDRGEGCQASKTGTREHGLFA